ncbi:MAG: PEP-utilizing enzyme [Gammaproteobacteria bacterium]
MQIIKKFETPGPGVWELDNSHFSRPMSLFSKEMFTTSLVQGLKEGTNRYGLALSHLAYAMVNGFFYKKPVLCGISDDHYGPLPRDLFERNYILNRLEVGKKALETKLWREDLKKWDNEVKPDSINRNKCLQAILPHSLSDTALIQHLKTCYENALEMMYRHHVFTIPAVLPIGLFVSKVREWTGLPSSELLYLLKGSTPISKGAADNELDSIVTCFKRERICPENYVGESALDVLNDIKSKCDPITKQALNSYLDFVNYRLITGYDVTDKFGLDMPDLIVSNIWNRYLQTNNTNSDVSLHEKTEYVRSKVPAIHQNEFDSLLIEARMINRLRDERGIYNDVLGTGLARRAILEAGKRLEEQNCLPDRNLLLHASYEEIIVLLNDKTSALNNELVDRATWFENHTVDDAPLILGGESVSKPPISAFPEIARPGMIALFTAIGEIYDSSENNAKKNELISGTPVSSGVYEGTARVICTTKDFNNLMQGDVLVTKNTTAAFNAILSLLGAIITDRGGQLSHAAIVSREYGIPAVVSTGNATQIIKDGARVRVDGIKGTVEVLS